MSEIEEHPLQEPQPPNSFDDLWEANNLAPTTFEELIKRHWDTLVDWQKVELERKKKKGRV